MAAQMKTTADDVTSAGTDDEKYAAYGDVDVDFRLTVPPPEVQRAMIGELERDGADESLHVYTVSKDWYDRWRAYVGLAAAGAALSTADLVKSNPESSSNSPPAAEQPVRTRSKDSPSPARRPAVAASETCRSRTASTSADTGVGLKSAAAAAAGTAGTGGERCKSAGVQPSVSPSSPPPGPIEMDLTDDQNMSVDEKVWKLWVSWYGVSDTHELDRRSWASEERDFEICVMSPYCGLVDNAVKTFDVSEETGYAELQLRRVFRVAAHRQTRLWVCEKARHARFQPLLERTQELCFQDNVDHNRSYILAIEVAELDGSWPTRVPGEPVGSFDRYEALVGRALLTGWPAGRLGRHDDSFWEEELGATLDSVFGGITAALKETATGIVNTVKCMTSRHRTELDGVRRKLESKLVDVEESRVDLERQVVGLAQDEARLAADREKLVVERTAFEAERQTFAEELVRMHTINKIQESRVKLNVGGHVFMTSTLTLTKDPDSMLAAMFSGRHAVRQDDADGSVFIDRDGTHFRYILNFLRDGHYRPGTLPSDVGFLSELCTEAEYYQLNGLARIINVHIRSAADGADDGSAGAVSGSGSAGYFGCSSPPKSVIVGGGGLGKAAASPAGKKLLQRKVSSQTPK